MEQLMAGGPVLTDGAWGTELQAQGLALGENPDSWNLSHGDRVAAVARSYVDAGSHIILTNTFRANRMALGEPAEAVRRINAAGVALSRRAAQGRARVFASMGPSGKLLAAGEVSEQELSEAFAEQAAVLQEAGAEALVIETMADLTEAKLALAAARRTGLPVIVSLVFDSGRNRDRTMMGVTPEQAAAELTAAGADAIGANCGRGAAGYVEICRRLAAATSKPVWIKPNAGLPELEGGRPVYRTSPEEFAAYVPALAQAGARFIGGCCGTTPEFIRSMAQRLSECVSS